MKEMKEAKQIYDSIEIPDELSDVVNQSINNMNQRRVISMRKRNYKKVVGGVLAASFLCAVVTLNTNETFAKTMQEIPVIGTVAKVLTIRSYKEVDEDKSISVKVPEVVNDDNSSFISNVNEKIQSLVDMHVKEAEDRILEYKDAFISTGGTEEEFAAKDIKVDVNYEIKSQTDSMVSFVITSNENWAGAYTYQYFYNLDLKNNKDITLEDLLGENYIEIANESIKEQMEERQKADPNVSYFDVDMGGFTSINEDTNFYINEENHPVIVFEKYEIAPGAMGIQEFEIVNN